MTDFEKPGLIQMKLYEIEKRLQDESLKAVLKSQHREPKQKPLIIKKKPLKIVLKDTPENIGKLAMRDFEIERKLMNDTNEALGITSKITEPTNILTSVTPEMIEDQQIINALKQPIRTSIELEKPNELFEIEDYMEEQLKQSAKQFFDETADINIEMEENRTQLSDLTEQYNTVTEKNTKLLRENKNRVPGGKANVEQQQKLLTLDYVYKKEQLNKEYEELKRSLEKSEKRYNNILELINQYREEVEANEKEQLRVDRINQGLLEDYAFHLSLLNPKVGLLKQRGDETDEEFKTRLDSVFIPISDDDRKQMEGRLSFEQAKRNLKQFFTDPSRVEFLVKQIENRNEFNKIFTKIKTDYLARYGVDNKQISNEEVIDYITEAIKQPNFLSSPQTINKNEYYAVGHYKSGDLIRIAGDNNVPISGTKNELYERLLLNGFLPKKTVSLRLPAVPTNTPFIFPQVLSSNLKSQPGELAGVGVKNYPKTVKFGKVTISLDDLYYKNMLKIRLPNKRSIIGFPNKRISDIFVSIIMKLIEGNPITKTDLDFLKPAEKTMYDKLLVVSGLHKTVSNTFEETIEEMKQRLRLIEGQLKAGNDNTSILKEAHSILHGMSACGLISGNAASRYYKELKASQME